jgi:carboxynorspermidine decarboxylase
MRRESRFEGLSLARVPSPCYVIDELAIEENCQILDKVQKRTGCKILLALKGFSVFSLFPLIRKYLHGTCASGLYEARLGKEKFGKEVHVFAPAYNDHEFAQLLQISDHIVFNSLDQWERLRPLVEKNRRKISCGIRINPEYSEITTNLWNPCAKYSRFGVKASDFHSVPEGIEGLHFHALCEQNSDTLERVLAVIEKKFGKYLSQVQWVNFGGGHLITRPDYDIDRLCRIITDFRRKYNVDVYMEPGEAVGLNAGILLARVLDIVRNDVEIAILDVSAWAHIPDILTAPLTAPYKPDIIGGGEPSQLKNTYRLASRSCMSGDILGDYSFPQPLHRGSNIMFSDMASYPAVSNNIFNGIPLPAIAILTKSKDVRIVRQFGYEDYEARLS